MRLALILAVVVFVITLLVRLPARALGSLLPKNVACATPQGTVWSGWCEQLRVDDMSLASLSWRLHPLALLRLHLDADVSSDDPAAPGHAHLQVAPGGDLTLTGLSASAMLPGRFGPLPAGASGILVLAIDSAQTHAGHLTALEGSFELRRLHLASPAADLGSVELKFPPRTAGTALTGQLHDLSGPLSLVGTVTLTPDGGYELDSTLAAKDPADAQLAQALQMLGPPDATGRHSLSIAGTL
ncbi:MAG TPA: type II secretion system protein N [Steroidobacteraceae bacterium]